MSNEKKSNGIIGNRTRDLSVCSAVPQPNMSPRVPRICWYTLKLNVLSDLQRKLTLRSSIKIHCTVWEMNGATEQQISDSISYKHRLMHNYIIHITLLALCYCNMLRPSKDHLQRVRLIHFHSQMKEMCKTKVKFTLEQATKHQRGEDV